MPEEKDHQLESGSALMVSGERCHYFPRTENFGNIKAEIERLNKLLEESRHQRLKAEKNREKLRRVIARLKAKVNAIQSPDDTGAA